MEDLSEKQNGVAEMQKQVAELTQENDQLFSQLHQIQEEFEKYILAYRKMEQESEERSRQVQELTEALRRAEEDAQAVRQENASETDSRIQDLVRENEDFLRHLHHTQEEFEKYILRYREKEAEARESADRADRLAQSVRQAEESLKAMLEEKRQRTVAENAVKRCIADLEETISGLTLEHERMRYEYGALQEAHESDTVLLEEKSKLESENASLQDDLDTARNALDEYMAQADMKSMKYAEMQRMLEDQIVELSETLARITMESEGMAFAMTKMDGIQ